MNSQSFVAQYQEHVTQACDFIRSFKTPPPSIGIILGSGLGAFADSLPGAQRIPYRDIPGFAETTVPGHSGTLVLGEYQAIPLIVLKGRFHYYEGHDMPTVTLPTRVLVSLGIKILIVTNAAGGINPNFQPGDLMLLTDHLNLMGVNPLRGPNFVQWGPRFPDQSSVYQRSLRDLAQVCAGELQFQVQQGVYAGLSGPTYETPAEIRMLRALGADAVGMSTVPEAVVANHMGCKVLGISCISNLAAGLAHQPLTHDEVEAITAQTASRFISFLNRILVALARG